MIVDFVKIKENLNKKLGLFVSAEIKRSAPFFASLNKNIIHEGDQIQYETVEHSEKELELHLATSPFTFSSDEIENIKLADIFKKFQNSANDLARQMEKGVFQDIDKTVKETGNIISGSYKSFSDSFLQTLELMNIDFEDDMRDKPLTLNIVTDPDIYKKAIEEEKNMTTEQKRQFEDKKNKILDKKYEDYIEREGKRKLID